MPQKEPDWRTQNEKTLSDYVQSRGTEKSTLETQSDVVRNFSEYIQILFSEVTRGDVDRWISYHEKRITCRGEPTAITSINLFKGTLKTFYRWWHERELEAEIEKTRSTMKSKGKTPREIESKLTELESHHATFPYCVSHLKTKMVRKEIKPNQLLTPDDIQKMLNSADHPQEKAIIALIWDVMMREGQLASLKVGDLIITDGKIDIEVEMDHNERRTIPLMDSYPYILQWLNLSQYFYLASSDSWFRECERCIVPNIKHLFSPVFRFGFSLNLSD